MCECGRRVHVRVCVCTRKRDSNVLVVLLQQKLCDGVRTCECHERRSGRMREFDEGVSVMKGEVVAQSKSELLKFCCCMVLLPLTKHH